MRRECLERFPRHRLQRKPLVSDPGMSGSLTGGGGENVPSFPSACATCDFTYLAWIPCYKARFCGQRKGMRNDSIHVSRSYRYNDIVMSTMTSQITSLTSVFSAAYLGADKRKYQNSASLAFGREIHRWPVNSPHKRPVPGKMFPFDDVIMIIVFLLRLENRLHKVLMKVDKLTLIKTSTGIDADASKGKTRPGLFWQPVGLMI